jgi:hypothetical protein
VFRTMLTEKFSGGHSQCPAPPGIAVCSAQMQTAIPSGCPLFKIQLGFEGLRLAAGGWHMSSFLDYQANQANGEMLRGNPKVGRIAEKDLTFRPILRKELYVKLGSLVFRSSYHRGSPWIYGHRRSSGWNSQDSVLRFSGRLFGGADFGTQGSVTLPKAVS